MPPLKEKISIIIPTYNRSKQLQDCLFAISKQDYRDIFELIIVDDGSKDDTEEIVNQFSRKNKRNINVTYISQENQGCASARNTGIQNATGDYLFFTDDDCIVPENWITRIMEGFKKYPEAVGVGGWYEVDKEILERNKYLQVFDFTHTAYYCDYKNYEFTSNSFEEKAYGNSIGLCYKKEVFDKIGCFDDCISNSYFIDWEFKIRAHYEGLLLLYVPLVVKCKKIINFLDFLQISFNYGRIDSYLKTRFFKYNKSINSLPVFFSNINIFYKKRQNHQIGYYLVFLLCRAVGVNFLNNKSQVFYRMRNIEILKFNKENISTNTKESCTYISDDFYYNSNDFIKLRIFAASLLEQNYSMPFISIIIPFYNRPEYVNDFFINNLNSLFCSDTAVELIFIDDGSTDNTLEKLQESIPKFRFKTRVLTKENGGPASARNVGIRNAEGEYIFMTDSDVAVPKYWLRELLVPFLYNPEIVLVGGGQINLNPRTVFDVWRNNRNARRSLLLTNSTFWEKSPPSDTANMVIKKSNNFFFDEIYKFAYEDLDFVYNIKKQNKMVCYVPLFVSNLRSMNYRECQRMIKAYADGYGIFMNKNKESSYSTNFYIILSIFFTKDSYSIRFLNILFYLKRRYENVDVVKF